MPFCTINSCSWHKVLETPLIQIITLRVVPNAIPISLNFDSHMLVLYRIYNFSLLQDKYFCHSTGCVTKWWSISRYCIVSFILCSFTQLFHVWFELKYSWILISVRRTTQSISNGYKILGDSPPVILKWVLGLGFYERNPFFKRKFHVIWYTYRYTSITFLLLQKTWITFCQTCFHCKRITVCSY